MRIFGRAGGKRRKAAPLSRTYRSLAHNLYFFRVLAAATIAAIVYVFRDYVTPIIDSYTLCREDTFIGSIGWIAPKIVSHCEIVLEAGLYRHTRELFQNLMNTQYVAIGAYPAHPAMNIVIVIDLYILVVWALFFVHAIANIHRIEKRDYLWLYKRMDRNSTWFLVVTTVWGCVMFLGCLHGALVWLPVLHTEPVYSRYEALFDMLGSPAGVGPFFQTVFAASSSWLLVAMVMFFGFWRRRFRTRRRARRAGVVGAGRA